MFKRYQNWRFNFTIILFCCSNAVPDLVLVPDQWNMLLRGQLSQVSEIIQTHWTTGQEKPFILVQPLFSGGQRGSQRLRQDWVFFKHDFYFRITFRRIKLTFSKVSSAETQTINAHSFIMMFSIAPFIVFLIY